MTVLTLAGPALASPVTVMTIGDSLTAGYNGQTQDDTGFRAPLYFDMAAQGSPIQYIGTYDPTNFSIATGNLVQGYDQQMTAIGENHTNGYSGYTTTDLVGNMFGLETPAQAANPDCLTNMGGYWMTGGNGTGRSALYPDVVLFMAGLNDGWLYIPLGNTSMPGSTMGNIAQMLTWFNINRPFTHVVVASEPLPSGSGANYWAIDNAEADVLPAYMAANCPQDRFINLSQVVPDNEFGDSNHPNDTGYALLAQAWAAGIASVVPSGNGYTNTGNAYVFSSTVPNLTGSMNNWQGVIDLSSDNMIVQGGNLTTITNQIKSGYAGGTWGGLGAFNTTGITSSAAADDTTHLTALGIMQNVNPTGGAIYSTFEGQASTAADVLVMYTYYGDANLDGKVDGSDYSLIDNGYLSQSTTNPLSGWSNGDFNYDGVIDGSDYTLIDNAFNNQGTSLAVAAAQTTQIATVVPEPAGAALAALGMLALRRRRKARRADSRN